MSIHDTSALLALLDRDDEHHADAKAAWAVLANQEADLMRLRSAFAYDKHFGEQGFSLPEKPLPE